MRSPLFLTNFIILLPFVTENSDSSVNINFLLIFYYFLEANDNISLQKIKADGWNEHQWWKLWLGIMFT